MESWRTVWREGVVPGLSLSALKAIRRAVAEDDARLIQGSTTVPPPLACVQDWPVEGACGLGYCGWQGEGLNTVGETEEYFARMCFDIDQRIGEPAACRWFINWFDETPREEMRREFLPEIDRAINERKAAELARSA